MIRGRGISVSVLVVFPFVFVAAISKNPTLAVGIIDRISCWRNHLPREITGRRPSGGGAASCGHHLRPARPGEVGRPPFRGDASNQVYAENPDPVQPRDSMRSTGTTENPKRR